MVSRGLNEPQEPLEIGCRYRYHPPVNTKLPWLIAAISGSHPTSESHGLSEPHPEVRDGIRYLYQAQDSTKQLLISPTSTPPPTTEQLGSSVPPLRPPRHSPASGRRHPASINSRQRVLWRTPTDNSTSHPTTDRRGYRDADSDRGWEAQSRRRGR